MAANPDADASVEPGQRIGGLRLRGMIPADSPGYRAFMESTYAPRLAAIGFDPSFGAQAKDSPDRQKLRQQLVSLVGVEGRDPAVRAKLKAAATKYLAGDAKALDPAFLEIALNVVAEDGNVDTAKMLMEKALSSEDPTLRDAALGAAGSSGKADVANYLLGLNDKRMRSYDRINLIYELAETAGTRDLTRDWILANYDKLLASGNGIFITSRLPAAVRFQCGVAAADRIDKVMGPKVRKADVGVLEFERTVETIRDCGMLEQAKGSEVKAAFGG
jgi:hypothetical protein